jgi:hypothetical protein
MNPYDEVKKENIWGSRILIKGEKTFFLQPGEALQDGAVQSVIIMSEEEALLL